VTEYAIANIKPFGRAFFMRPTTSSCNPLNRSPLSGCTRPAATGHDDGDGRSVILPVSACRNPGAAIYVQGNEKLNAE
jgi:hypothetical protein